MTVLQTLGHLPIGMMRNDGGVHEHVSTDGSTTGYGAELGPQVVSSTSNPR